MYDNGKEKLGEETAKVTENPPKEEKKKMVEEETVAEDVGAELVQTKEGEAGGGGVGPTEVAEEMAGTVASVVLVGEPVSVSEEVIEATEAAAVTSEASLVIDTLAHENEVKPAPIVDIPPVPVIEQPRPHESGVRERSEDILTCSGVSDGYPHRLFMRHGGIAVDCFMFLQAPQVLPETSDRMLSRINSFPGKQLMKHKNHSSSSPVDMGNLMTAETGMLFAAAFNRIHVLHVNCMFFSTFGGLLRQKKANKTSKQLLTYSFALEFQVLPTVKSCNGYSSKDERKPSFMY
ncbi:hypothetical protein COCNU_02G004790 [Cocos nucifera]|uniref:Uncharacterized protein n=1 Tax=Cocos nucifera TaxID=13894 RepID=A0A8K0HY92_COCNU|nr:hypothetical protein COCNU_02G004790 [Cocos nucifera]